MNDDQLRAELERRSRSVKDVASLAPAVRSAIESRPAPVGASRLAPLAGLAGIAAALLLLVVAIPRLSPGPPSASSWPERPSPSVHAQRGVLEVSAIASRLASGDLDGTTVVVAGRIGPNARRGPVCPPVTGDSVCYLGPLEGVDPPIDVFGRWTPSTESGRTSTIEGGPPWKLWHFPSGPIEGLIVVSVSDAGQVQFVGLAQESDRGLSWSPTDVQGLGIGARTADEVVLVAGWLTQVSDFVECPAPAEGERIAGLPDRDCGRLAFLADRPLEPAPFGSVAGLEVQPDAYYQFAADPSAQGEPVEPRWSTYAVAPRLEGWCGVDPAPCWRWHVVARLTDEIEPSPASPLPTVTPRAAPSVAESPAPMTHILCPPVRGSLGDVAPTVVDSTGLVDACVASSPIDDRGRIVKNPDGDQTVLQVDWSGDSCDAAATLSLKRVESRYRLDFTPSPGGCFQLYAAYSIQLLLSGAIDGDDVFVTHGEPGGTGLGSAWWELAADERPTDASSDLGLVVYEAGCASGQSPEGRVEGPTIAYSATEVVITFTVRPPPGTIRTCPSAPGVPVSVHLAEPLGGRALVDGAFGPVTLERADDFLALSSGRVDETAHERLRALAGPDACISNVQYDRYVPTQAELEGWAADLGSGSGFVPVGSTPPQAYLGDWLEAAHAFGAIEAFEGRPKPWYIITPEPPMNRNVPGGSFTLASLDPFPVSGGRTIWFAGFYQATTAAPGACRR
ncbi:hypothetical protein BH24CHL5_BH24CHL5_03890 [soil metagenome]